MIARGAIIDNQYLSNDLSSAKSAPNQTSQQISFYLNDYLQNYNKSNKESIQELTINIREAQTYEDDSVDYWFDVEIITKRKYHHEY